MAAHKNGLSPDTAPDVALRHIVASCHVDLSKYRTVVLESRRPIGIHQTRVAFRRMRAAFSVFRDAVNGPGVRSLSAEARWLAGECAPARDPHVFLTESIEDVPPMVSRIAARLAAVHLQRARAALSGARFTAFDRQLTNFAAQPPSGRNSRLEDFGREVLDKRHRKVERRGCGLSHLDAEELHELRIAIKKQRYAATFLQPAFASAAAKPYIEATVRLQGALGALNDRAVAARMLDDIATAARPTEDVAGTLKALTKQAGSGDKRRRRKLEGAWKDFKNTERFWLA